MAGWTARELCPGAIFVRRASRRTPQREQGRVQASSTTRRRWWRGCRSTRRSSTCAGCERIAGTPAEIAARLRVRVRDEVGLPITVGVARDEVPGEGGLARVAKPDGLLLVVPSTASSSSCTRCRSRRCGASGKVTAGKLHARGIMTRSGRWRRSRRRCWSGCVGKASGRQLHALAHGRDPRRGDDVGVRRRSIGGQRALGRRGARRPPRRWTRRWSRWSTGSGGACGRRGGSCRTVILRLRFDDFSRATRSHDDGAADGDSRAAARRRARAAGGRRCRRSRRAGVTLVGLSLTNLEDADAVQLALPRRPRRTLALDAAVDEVRDRFGARRAHARRARRAATPASQMPLLPND